MSIDKHRLAAHLDDYFCVTDRKTDRFVCPITLQQCDTHELINPGLFTIPIRVA